MRESVQEWRDRACLEQNGREYEALGKIAQANNLYLSGNVYEIDPHFPELYFQTCFIIGPNGKGKPTFLKLLAEISGLKAQLAGDYVALAVSPPNQLVVTLKAVYNKDYCDRPDVKRELEQEFARQIGRTVRIEFAVAAPADVPPTEKRSPAVSRQQRMRELEQHPLVQEAVRLFDAEIVRGEERRGG